MELKPRNGSDWSKVDAVPAEDGILVVNIKSLGNRIVDTVEIEHKSGVMVRDDISRPGYYRIVQGVGSVTIPVPYSSNSVSHQVSEFQEFVTPPVYPTAW